MSKSLNRLNMMPTKISPFFEEKNKEQCEPSKTNCLASFFNFRLCIALLMMFNFFCGTSMRMNLSMAVVCMVNSTAYAHPLPAAHSLNATLEMRTQFGGEQQCPLQMNLDTTGNKGYNGNLLWTPGMQSQLFSAFFYGSLLTTWFSGYFADIFGPKLLLSIAMADYVFISLITPLLATYSFYAYLVARVIMGMGEGLVYPAIASVSSRWFPPQEKSTMAGLYTMGNQLAAVFGLLVSSKLCSLELFGGWPLIFYFFASVGLVCAILWLIFATDNPADNQWISSTENMYIEKATVSQWSLQGTLGHACKSNQHSKQLSSNPLPWKKMLTSLPVLAMLVSNASFGFTATVMQSYLPTFFKEVMRLDLSQNGLYSIIPFSLQLCLKIPYGQVSDSLKKRRVLSNTAACILFQSVGSFGYALCFLLMATFADCTQLNLVVMLLVLYGLVAPTAICGFFTAMLSLAPAYSGAVTSFTTGFSTITQALAPSMVALFNKNGRTAEWSMIWYTLSTINFLAGLVFVFFGSADVQEWAMPNYGSKQISSSEKKSAGVPKEKVMSSANMS